MQLLILADLRRFDQLQKIDVEGVEPCTRASMANLLAAREDIPVEFENRYDAHEA